MYTLMLMLWTNLASASYSVEGPSFAGRADAAKYGKLLKDNGYKGRIVRRYRNGKGWEFVVRVDGFSDESKATTAARSILEATGLSVHTLDEDGKQLQLLESVVVEPKKPQATEKPSTWLDDAFEAHGPGLAVLSATEKVRMVYTRALPDGRVANHVYVRRGTDLYMEISAKKGEIRNSTTVALADHAFLIQDSQRTEQDLQRARETIKGFGPEGVIPIVLELDRIGKDHTILLGLVEKGTAKVADSTCTVVGSIDNSTLIAIDPKGLIRKISLGNEAKVYEFSDYQELGDVMIPHGIKTTVDGITNTVQVEKIETDFIMDDSMFRVDSD